MEPGAAAAIREVRPLVGAAQTLELTAGRATTTRRARADELGLDAVIAPWKPSASPRKISDGFPRVCVCGNIGGIHRREPARAGRA